MIQSLTIQCFQSHKCSRLDLSPGINTLVGDSDQGKSATLRALLWCVTNSPSGDAYVSDWIKTPKGKIKAGEACRVVVDTNPGDGKRSVCRVRADDFNGYKLYDGGDDCQEFSALRTDVPQAVQDAFNLGPVNIQRQMDPPFLIAETPGEAARIVNGLVDLSIIDDTLAEISSVSRANTSEMKHVSQDLEAKVKELESLSWVEELENLSSRISELEERIQEKRDMVSSLSSDLETYEGLESVVCNISPVLHDASYTMDSVAPVQVKMGNTMRRLNSMEHSLQDWDRIPDLGDLPDLAESVMDQARIVMDMVTRRNTRIKDLESDLHVVGSATRFLEITGQLEDVEDTMSRIPRMERAMSGTRESIHMMETTLEDYDRIRDQCGDDVSRSIQEMEDELATMACPLCGRPGCKCK